MALNTYLFFDGQCGEAFDFYREVFGGEFAARMTTADAPAEVPVDRTDPDRIMHVSLPIGSSVLMGSDMRGTGAPSAFSISYSAASREEADAKHAALSAGGGSTTMPMEDVFWGSYFGAVRDRFGVSWQVSHDPARS
ncbi:MAG TPA: VOC family protein [Paracoccaceae bacterium]|nr:VOC family protein [Paracoccaceae bacterium]